MNDIIIRSDEDEIVDKRLAELTNLLIVDSDESSEKYVKELIEELNNIPKSGIPCLSDILQPMIDNNDTVIDIIMKTLIVNDRVDMPTDCDRGATDRSSCAECEELCECYEDLDYEIRLDEFPQCDDTHLAYLLYYILVNTGMSMIMEKDDYNAFPDFCMHFDYDNEGILSDYFTGTENKNKVIVNHAQQMMFSEIFMEENNQNGSCYCYGQNFAIMFDNYNIQEERLALKEGGK